MTITAQMVKALREKTGVGMMDCKTALNETGGDMEAAVDGVAGGPQRFRIAEAKPPKISLTFLTLSEQKKSEFRI